jgi:hypothetical protein
MGDCKYCKDKLTKDPGFEQIAKMFLLTAFCVFSFYQSVKYELPHRYAALFKASPAIVLWAQSNGLFQKHPKENDADY